MRHMTPREEHKRQLGQRIRLLRDSRGITVEQCVDIAESEHGIKIHSNTWGNVENGKGGAGRTLAAIELVLRLRRGVCKDYLDNGGDVESIEPVTESVDEAPHDGAEQMAAAIQRLSDDDLYRSGIERHEIAVVRAVAEKILRNGVPGESRAYGA